MASRWRTFIIVGTIYAILAAVLGTLMVIPMKKEYRAYVYRFGFVCVLQTLILLGALNVWSHLKNLPQHLKIKSVVCLRLWQTLIGLFIVCAHGSYLTVFFNSTEPKLWAFSAFVVLGTFIQLNVCILTITAVRYLLRLVGFLPKPRRVSGSELDPSAASKLHREKATSGIVAIVYAVLVATYGVWQAKQPPIIRAVDIPIEGLPAAFNDLRIVQISDIHLGPTVGKSQLEGVVQQVIELKPGIDL